MTQLAPLKTGPWTLTDLEAVPKNGLKVFSCFHCGGGSTMGYKLAGYEMLGGVDIDPQMMGLYRQNHKPKHSYLMGVEEFNQIPNSEIPSELFDLDILDGSPPCSSFSMAGSRENGWGTEKKFREGQAEQVLDDLFFHFISTAGKLRPKIIIAENVKGLIIGKARGYVKEIFSEFNSAGYNTQLFLLNAARMGVPQSRERTFFICRRKNLALNKLALNFDEKPVSAKEAIAALSIQIGRPLTPETSLLWARTKPGRSLADAHPTGSGFSMKKIHPDLPINTLTATGTIYHWNEPRAFSGQELVQFQTFPKDYNFLGTNPAYTCGMSVPPFMMQRVAREIHRQWFGGTDVA